jgi:hypothetical protein
VVPLYLTYFLEELLQDLRPLLCSLFSLVKTPGNFFGGLHTANLALTAAIVSFSASWAVLRASSSSCYPISKYLSSRWLSVGNIPLHRSQNLINIGCNDLGYFYGVGLELFFCKAYNLLALGDLDEAPCFVKVLKIISKVIYGWPSASLVPRRTSRRT